MNDFKEWNGLTIERTLSIGVLYAGTRHKRVVLRVGMAGDLVEAQRDSPDGNARAIALDLYRRQMLVLGDIPTKEITLTLLMEQLAEPDLAVLEAADAALGKQLSEVSDPPPSDTGGSSSTASSAMATA